MVLVLVFETIPISCSLPEHRATSKSSILCCRHQMINSLWALAIHLVGNPILQASESEDSDIEFTVSKLFVPCIKQSPQQRSLLLPTTNGVC